MMSTCQQVLWAPLNDLTSSTYSLTEYHHTWIPRMQDTLNTAVQSCITNVVLDVGSPPFNPARAALCLNDTFNANSLPPCGAALDQSAGDQV